ncbi:MAG TPA: hypothetical protein DCG75_02600 [Bacteroidales bacterium]|nr:hypothetical protein [Bacteroidales bacterium]
MQKRADRFIEKTYRKADTIYKYSVAFNNFNIVWYHKDGYLYKYRISPHMIKKYEPIVAENIFISKSSLSKYFDESIYKNVECFYHLLDGASIDIYFKNGKNLRSSIDIDCLFGQKYPVNSIPYKLQYDFSKMGQFVDFNFEDLYQDNH